MSTPASGSTPYATVAQFLERYDVRTVSQLLSDGRAPLTPAQVAASTILNDLLAEASGEVESAATVGGMYQINLNAAPPINDLAALTGNSAAFLVRLVCDLAMGALWERRPDRQGEEPKYCDRARRKLEDLEKGKAVFGLLENQQAGQLGITIDAPSQVRARRSPVIIAGRFFGRRSIQYPQNPA